MKKFFTVLFISLAFFGTSIKIANAETFDYVGGAFDWLYITHEERTQRVKQIFDIMFPKGYVTNFPKGYLKKKLKANLKDKDYQSHYDAVCAGHTHYGNVDLQPFYSGNTKIVYMYALQYTDMPKRTFYYDAMGHLKFIDFRYGDYPNCPYYTKKYTIKGKLVRAMYLQNPETMYIYSDNGAFIGVKYRNSIFGFSKSTK